MPDEQHLQFCVCRRKYRSAVDYDADYHCWQRRCYGAGQRRATVQAIQCDSIRFIGAALVKRSARMSVCHLRSANLLLMLHLPPFAVMLSVALAVRTAGLSAPRPDHQLKAAGCHLLRRGDKQTTTWHRVTAWNGLAETVVKYLEKGGGCW